jgi:AAA15 family ATPase/GTPase
MKIKKLQLKNFKRFTDLTLQNIPDNAKLVLLIGSNGSGKSSVFDAFEAINKNLKLEKKSNPVKDIEESRYYKKDKSKPFLINFFADNHQNEQFISVNSSSLANTGNSFYGRSAVRYFPRLERTFIGTPIKVAEDSDRPKYYIDKDNRFETDIDLLLSLILKKVFNERNIKDIEKFIERVNESLLRIFRSTNYNQLQLINFETPAEGNPAQLIFKKGSVEIYYDLLSAGEKEIIILLINLYVRSPYFTDTLYFFDEIDTHLNTQLQYSLLKEIVENWIPDNCQLWTASHSLGFIQYANDYENGCILDFDDLDFDKKQVLSPQPKNSMEIFEIAVSKSFIDQVVQGRKIIFSENTDTPFYNDLTLKDTLFFVASDKMEVFQKAKNLRQSGLIDRDYLSDLEVTQLKKDYPFLYILPYYSFENLIYHPDNLTEYYLEKGMPFDKAAYVNKLVDIKNKEKDYWLMGIVGARNGYPFYKENENSKKLKEFKESSRDIVDLLKSDDLESFYKVFPAKDYGKQLPERQNLSASELSKTNWFKTQIEKTIK